MEIYELKLLSFSKISSTYELPSHIYEENAMNASFSRGGIIDH